MAYCSQKHHLNKLFMAYPSDRRGVDTSSIFFRLSKPRSKRRWGFNKKRAARLLEQAGLISKRS